MDTTIVKAFDEHRHDLRRAIELSTPTTYDGICRVIARTVLPEGTAHHTSYLDEEAYEGEILATFTAPDGRTWRTNIWYGSCSGCDDLEHALYQERDNAAAVYAVAVQIVQGLAPVEAA